MKTFRIKRIKIINNNQIFNGHEAIMCPKGTVFLVTDESIANVGDTIIRTDNLKKPFITIKIKGIPVEDTSGQLWGNSVENYQFLSILITKEIQDLITSLNI